VAVREGESIPSLRRPWEKRGASQGAIKKKGESGTGKSGPPKRGAGSQPPGETVK